MRKSTGVLILGLCLANVVPVACGKAQMSAVSDGVPFALKLQQKCGGQKRCEIAFPPVAPGHRLTIERIAIAAEIVGGRSLEAAFSGPPTGGLLAGASFAVSGQDALILHERSVRYNIDGGTAYATILNTDGFFSTIAPAVAVTVSGRLLDCTASNCATDVVY